MTEKPAENPMSPTPSVPNGGPPSSDANASVEFLKGSESAFGKNQSASENKSDTIRRELTNAMSAKNLAFLLGAGCSSLKEKDVGGEDAIEKGIPTMAPLAKEFKDQLNEMNGGNPFSDINKMIDLSRFGDLEELLRVLYGMKLFFSHSSEQCAAGNLSVTEAAIKKLERYFLEKINIDLQNADDITGLYQSFYRRIFFRERLLPRPWVFTTNYDLLNEYALDMLGIPYCNGFSGGITRRFNPATFNLSLARPMDVSANRWAAVDSFVYLCKLHGSISWVRDKEGPWPFKELSPEMLDGNEDRVMIYPTPAKEGQSLGSPYSDMFREFRSRIVRDQSVLLVIGYGFSDDHINNIIRQALTIPSFRLIVFSDPQSPFVKELMPLNDPRIWVIWGSRKEHFFKNVVEHFLPEAPEEKAESIIRKIKSYGQTDDE